MRVTSFVIPDGTTSYGVVEAEGLRDVGAGFRARYSDLRAVIAADALEEMRDVAALGPLLDPGSVTFLSPVPNPDKIICIGLNYMSHIKETGREKPAKPSIFTRYPSSLVGHDAHLIRPKASDWFDFEGEIAVVIGKPGRDILEDQALDHVAGYSCFNDGSIRDFQRHTSQFWAGKNFDRSGSIGPWIVTSDELSDPSAQTLQTRLNGEIMQQASISDLAFSISELIAYVSIVTELLPGDIIATGTPSGVGLFREPKLFMKDGDLIEVEISGIGTLSNIVLDQN